MSPHYDKKKHQDILKIDHIQEKFEPKKSSQKHFCHYTNFSEGVQNRNDETVKISNNFENLENALVNFKKQKKRMIKCHTN